MGPSWTTSMGTFTGGQLWTGQEKGSIAPPFAAKGMYPCVKRKLVVARGKWHQFDGTKWHGVTPVKGYRLSFVYFNGKNLDQ
eukprot:12898260-Prorocentrum_lima.AAC.1